MCSVASIGLLVLSSIPVHFDEIALRLFMIHPSIVQAGLDCRFNLLDAVD